MKKLILIVAALTFVVAHAQTTVVNQGKPGTQGPWPVTFAFTPDGGGAIPVYSTICKQADNDGGTLHKLVTLTTASAANTPGVSATGRVYVEICNSLQNTGNPMVKCRADGQAPVMASGQAGTVLGIGDCVQFAASPYNVVQCITDTNSTNVTSYECVPGTPASL